MFSQSDDPQAPNSSPDNNELGVGCPRRISRRSILGAFAGGIGLSSAGILAVNKAGGDTSRNSAVAEAKDTSQSDGSNELATAGEDYPFEGKYQQGIVTPAQSAAAFVSLDIQSHRKEDLTKLMKTLTQRSRELTSGGEVPPADLRNPAPDSGELGESRPTDGLTITVGVGNSIFDKRFGLGGDKPRHLQKMQPFDDDSLEEGKCDGDLLVQFCAHHRDTVTHAVRDVLRHTRGMVAVRWQQSGYINPPRPSGTPRNHLGFKDGIVNPSKDQHEKLVWAAEDEPRWATGGSYMVVRLISMYTEFWDRISRAEQEQIFGRERETGGPLSGGDEFTPPDYSDDPTGTVTPLDAHIRLANPRTPESADQLMLRRSYNFDNGIAENGTLDLGLVFVCFQQDLDRQFIQVQKRLAGEPLADYIRPFGGGYFFALPGVNSSNDYFGKKLIEGK